MGKMGIRMTEWIDVKERIPDVHSGTYRVKLSDGTEMSAHFYRDKMAWIAFYGRKLSYW